MRRRARAPAWLAALAIASLSATACTSYSKVTRVYDGRIVTGPFVPSEAYASFLEGAIAEEAGDLERAAKAYQAAAEADDEDAAPLTRLGDVRCRMNPKDSAADSAFSRAASIDSGFAPLAAARSRCAAARGKADEAATFARTAVEADPTSMDIQALLVRALSPKPSPEGRERAIALTLLHGERPAAWDALVTWGKARGDAELQARGLEGLTRVSAARARDVERGALELAGAGHLGLARRVAAALVDAPIELGPTGRRDPTVARYAVDEALARGDGETAERRAARVHVSLAEVAARAALLEQREIATTLARTVSRADPGSSAAHMVLAALAVSPAPRLPSEMLLRVSDKPPEACAYLFADRLATAAGPDVAREWLGRVAAMPMVDHDPLVGPLAVELAARGVVQPAALPLELRVELAARRREAPPAIEAGRAQVDERHAFLWFAMTNPQGPDAKALAGKLGSAVDRDPIVGFAFARLALAARGETSALGDPLRRAFAASPAHPLILAAAVEIAKQLGRGDDVAPARVRLMAVAQTPAERALATE